MRTTKLPEPQDIERHLRRQVCAEIHAERRGDLVAVDTPFTLQNGALLRVFLEPSEGGLLVSDGGYAAEIADSMSRSSALARQRHEAMKAIAAKLGLEWDGQFGYIARDADEALARIGTLERAVNLALATIEVRPAHADREGRSRVVTALRKHGLTVRQRALIDLPGPGGPVRVDLRIDGRGGEAAMEFLSGRTRQGASIAYNRAIVTLHRLDRGGYQGGLFSVYDEQSAAASTDFVQRFEEAKPERALLIPSSEAARQIAGRLVA